jgi:hypothetical protein
MHAWRGWTAVVQTTGITVPTWDEWRTHQRRLRSGEQRQQVCQQERMPFSARELARLSFVRWLHYSGRLAAGHNDNDREQGSTRYEESGGSSD